MASGAKRKRTIAEELTELTNPAPATDVDVEDALAFGGGAGATLVDSDGEGDAGGARAPTRRAPEAGLRLRGHIDLEGEEYVGRVTSRAAWQGDRQPPQPPRRGAPLPASDDDADDDDDGGSDDQDEEDEEEDEDGDGAHARAPAGWGAHTDAEAAALEAELAAVADAETTAAAALRARAGAERAKAVAVAAQRRLWEHTLSLRIALQRALVGAARLPPAGAARDAARAEHPAVAEALDSLAASAAAAAADLHELRAALCDNHPPVAAAAADAGVAVAPADGAKRRKSGGGKAAADADADSLWARLELGAAAFVPFRDAAFDRWHAKASLAGSAAAARAGGGLKALNQPPSAQVAALLRDPARARQRAAPLASAAPARLCCCAAAAPAAAPPPRADFSAPADPVDAPVAAAPRDEECYDDTEFYAQLLKELLESGGGAGGDAGAAVARAKVRRVVDRRASKGRKLRYSVVDKLVNFMAPVPMALEPQSEQLLKRLFGAMPRALA